MAENPIPIDFVNTDLGVLQFLASRPWIVYVLLEVLGEVEGLDAGKARELGIFVY